MYYETQLRKEELAEQEYARFSELYSKYRRRINIGPTQLGRINDHHYSYDSMKRWNDVIEWFGETYAWSDYKLSFEFFNAVLGKKRDWFIVRDMRYRYDEPENYVGYLAKNPKYGKTTKACGKEPYILVEQPYDV